MRDSRDSRPAIEFQGFSLAYLRHRHDSPLEVLADISLTVNEGEFITIVGPSGCGKTTLLRSVAGLIEEDAGHVELKGSLRVFGDSPSEARRKRRYGFTFQNPVLLPWRSVRQNVGLPLEIMNVSQKASSPLIDEMLTMVGIRDFENSMPSEISGGMKQRANLARALIQEPAILLMDEPFGSLDEVTRERLNFELLRIHRARGTTILFVTHNLSEATLLADRVIVLGKRPATIRDNIHVVYDQERTEDFILSSPYLESVRRLRCVFAEEGSQ